MSRARNMLIRACGQPRAANFHQLGGHATITGVAFYDRVHGQTGVAPNGIELHPVLAIKVTGC